MSNIKKVLYIVEFHGSKGWEIQHMGGSHEEAFKALKWLHEDGCNGRLTFEFKEV